SLRKWQTPTFRKLVSDLRQNRRLTPEQACAAAQTYTEYYQDVCSLTIEASCQTSTRIHKGGLCRYRSVTQDRSLFYMFARAAAPNSVYWSAYDPQASSGYAQTFWDEVSGLKNAINIIGAVPYQLAPGQRFIFLFARIPEKAKQKLVFIKYDLQKQTWDGEATDLELPKDGKEAV